jgi:hypothetical protein
MGVPAEGGKMTIQEATNAIGLLFNEAKLPAPENGIRLILTQLAESVELATLYKARAELSESLKKEPQ